MSESGTEIASSNNSNSNNDEVPSSSPAAPAANVPEPPRGGMFFDIVKSLIVRALFIYFITSFFRRPATPDITSVNTKLPSYNIFQNGTSMDMIVYLSEHEEFAHPDRKVIWEKKHLVYGDWASGDNHDGVFTQEVTFPTTKSMMNNGSIYMHVFFVNHGNEKQTNRDKSDYMVHTSKLINKFKKRKIVKMQNLLTGATTLTDEEIETAEKASDVVVSHWHPNLTINMVTDFTNWVESSVPSPANEYIIFNVDGETYKPVVFMNDFWNLARDYYPINDTSKELTLSLTYQPISLFKWQMYMALTMRSRLSANIFQDEASEEDEDQDSLKETLLETSPYLLALTIIVSVVHSIFELLAFKNDIQFWKDRKSLEGLSVRLVFFNVFQSLIVLLVVFDHETNTLVRISCIAGLGIEIWKINKVVDISLDRENKILGIFPRLKFAEKSSYVESSTKEYDQLAFKYLSWVLFPLLSGYAVYSLLYLEHRGWYSWLLNMIYGFLLTFGFITMTPQLFINYKLKSVAHLPWRMMTYKCLNTFIDDVFAFVIKMPTMYRLGCFRDDVIFFIFLYQRWIYKTDPTRLNEFGFSAEMEESKSKSIEAKKDD